MMLDRLGNLSIFARCIIHTPRASVDMQGLHNALGTHILMQIVTN